MKVCAIIPARFDSSRFQGKPLADINGRPMIWWVYNKVKKSSRINKVVVALDDERVARECEKYNIEYLFTSKLHQSSTERVHEVSDMEFFDYYICINGDEPLIDYKIIEKIIPKSLCNEIYVSNLMVKIKSPAEVIDFSNIKVAFSTSNYAVFMSRSPLPYPKSSLNFDYYKHIGVLCYNKKALDFFKNTKKGVIEGIEDINELRFIENHIPILMVPVETDILSVDTPKDLEFIKKYLIDNNISYEDI